jgi:signal transduction histidine kinase
LVVVTNHGIPKGEAGGPGGVFRALRRILPTGLPLPEAAWRRRHRTILLLLWSHAVGLAIFGVVRGVDVWHSAAEGAAVGAFAVAATLGTSRRSRSVMACLGILSSSAILVHLSGGTIEAHFHFFVMVGVISLYQDWGPFLLAIGYVVVHHGTAGVLDPESVYNHPAAIRNPWLWAGIHGLFILGACAVSLVAWRLNEDARARAEEYYRRLYEGEHAVVEELQQAQRMKDDLIAMVSHELRTPLTAIIGFGRTLYDYWDRLTQSERMEALDGSLRQADRLRRHVENLLEAARVSEKDTNAYTDLIEAVNTVLKELRDLPDAASLAFDANLQPAAVAMSADALHLVLVNVVGNAIKHASPGTVVSLRGGPLGNVERLFLTVANAAPPIPEEDINRIFEPFVQLDSSATRRVQGMGLGLHIVRRVVEMYEGSVGMTYRDGEVVFRVELPGAPAAAAPSIFAPGQDTAAVNP